MNIKEFNAALRRINYECSTQEHKKLPFDYGFEWAFMGRSNAGKSSLLNSLTGVKIAKTSKTPGRTQCMNSFNFSENHRIIDFPGYGFAKVDKQQIAKWELMIKKYLKNRNSLCGICIVMDIRHIGLKADLNFLEMTSNQTVPIRIVLNKCDKQSKNDNLRSLTEMQRIVKSYNHKNTSIQQFSTLKNIGADELIQWLHSCPIYTSV